MAGPQHARNDPGDVPEVRVAIGDPSAVHGTSGPNRDSAFRDFFENLAVGAVRLGSEGDFIEVNARFCALTGYRREDLLTMKVADLDHPDDHDADQDRWRAFLDDPTVGYDVEKRYVRRDGQTIWVHVTAAVIRYQGGQPLIAKTVEDVTDRFQAIAVLRESEERLRDALAVKEEFLGLVSHELRTPLTIIVGLADIISRETTSPTVVAEAARELRDSSEHLATLLESMLVLARADRHDGEPLEPLVLAHVVRRVVARHRTVHPDRRLQLDDHSAGALVEGHDPWIGQVVGNLVANAEKYSPPESEIRVEIARDGDEVSVRVADEGVGVMPDDLPLIFEPFYRAAHARESSGGLGLGLAVCKRLVELQSGHIWAIPRDGRGSEFGFALPVLDDAD
jgi:PAS domain S-box-containing protein